MKKDVKKDVTIIEELKIAIQTISYGLKSLSEINFLQDHYNAIFLLLSNGIERFFKITIIHHLIEKENEYPKEYPWYKEKKGHDIEYLLEYILDNCFHDQYLKKPIAKSDFEFLRNDKLFRKIISTISKYGQHLRYSNLDFIIDKNGENDTVEQIWSSLEFEILKELDPSFKCIKNPNENDMIYEKINELVSNSLKNGVEVLERLYKLGGIGSFAKSSGITISTYFRN